MTTKKGHLQKAERLEIYLLLKKKTYSHRDIADALGRDHTSISREISRNSSNGQYDPHQAEVKASNRRKLSKYQGMKIHACTGLERYLQEKLVQRWSPEKIAGRLKNVDTQLPYISAKGIYKWLYSGFGQAYCEYLFKKRYRRKKRKVKKSRREMIPDRVSIKFRPRSANQRSSYGHYEGDTIVSAKRHKTSASLSVLLERKARYVRIKKIKNLKPRTNRQALEKMFAKLRRKTLTLDNGIENKGQRELAQKSGIDIYFCDPYSSWQKGGVENVNGLIRRFIPKQANLKDYSWREIKRIETYLNHTPKKCLNFKTPHEVMVENDLFLNFLSP